MIDKLVYLMIVYVVVGCIWWLADYMPFPPPLNKMAKMISIIVAMIITIYLLLSMAGLSVPR